MHNIALPRFHTSSCTSLMKARRLLGAVLLLAAPGALLLLPPFAHATCSVPGIGEGELVLAPGAFNTPSVQPEQQASCPDPRAVPAASKAPCWLGVATAAHQIEVRCAWGVHMPHGMHLLFQVSRAHEGHKGAVSKSKCVIRL